MISPALTQKTCELFATDTEEYGVYDGITYESNNLPEPVRLLLLKQIHTDHSVLKELKIMHADPAKWIGQFIRCRYSRFDGTPDIDEHGRMGATEWTICDKRGSCRAEGILCKPVSLKNGELTRRETQVIQLIGLGLLDKEICAELYIAPDTLRNHKDNLSRKAGVERKAALAVVALRAGLTG